MKNKLNISLLVIISIFIALGCEDPNKSSNQPIQPGSKLDVKLNFAIEDKAIRNPHITGATNLPDGTELLITIKGKSIEYSAQEKTVVSNGGIKSVQFSSNGNELAAGDYTAQLTMSIAKVQNKQVREVIGEEGENLTGSLVKKNDTGIIVETIKEFQIK